jgi:hypothetical protein
VAVILVITATAAISSNSDGSNTDGSNSDGSVRSLPACARTGPAVTPPSWFPHSFPLPKHTVLTGHRRVPGGFVIVEGVEPLDVLNAARFLVRELPKAGYRLGQGDSEPGEAETDFSGHGVAGRVKVRVIPGCSQATSIVVGIVLR